jgi:hypothetical protein
VALALVLFHQLLLFLYFMGALDLNSDQPAPQPLSTPTTPGNFIYLSIYSYRIIE